eukprot:TRINITY_DN233_c0_g1_i1.p1 TRINITY_DN233_c0_g1~~TRINITY_DN233_c0_g1_i1.p1  ORF type:complete len:324 (+),score=41.21 TRINITY_DN233_c0_g1_i1:68-1039(+)
MLFTDLPDDIIQAIAESLFISDVHALMRSCRSICAMLSEESFWEAIARHKFGVGELVGETFRATVRLLMTMQADIKVLIIAGGVNDGSVEQLRCGIADLGFSSVVRTTTVPAVENLQHYDAVLVFSECGFSGKAPESSETLYQYVRAGGVVLLGGFALNRDNYGLQGTCVSNGPICAGKQETAPQGTGRWHVRKTHPVRYMLPKKITGIQLRSLNELDTHGILLANWSDEGPFAAVRKVEKGVIAACTAFLSPTYFSACEPQMYRLCANLLRFGHMAKHMSDLTLLQKPVGSTKHKTESASPQGSPPKRGKSLKSKVLHSVSG